MRIRDALRAWRDTPVLKVSSDPSDVESVTVRYLMYVLVPAWFVPGVADWVMHRRSRIERTSGLRESLIHALMSEIAVPVTLVLFCEVNPVLLALCTAAGLVHEGTAIWDVRAATDGGRECARPSSTFTASLSRSRSWRSRRCCACTGTV